MLSLVVSVALKLWGLPRCFLCFWRPSSFTVYRCINEKIIEIDSFSFVGILVASLWSKIGLKLFLGGRCGINKSNRRDSLPGERPLYQKPPLITKKVNPSRRNSLNQLAHTLDGWAQSSPPFSRSRWTVGSPSDRLPSPPRLHFPAPPFPSSSISSSLHPHWLFIDAPANIDLL